MKRERSTRINPKVIVPGDIVAVVWARADGSKYAWIGEVVWIHDAWLGVTKGDELLGVTRGQVTRVA